jgi:enamine deaminase RidA (YjgF/YER057c/UK114 family)
VIRPYNTRDTHPDEPNVRYDNELCQAIRAGNHVFLRGQVGATFAGEIVGLGDPAAQAEQAMRNVAQLLEEAGSSLKDVVQMTVYVTDWVHREPVYRVIGRWMRGIRYCSTGVTVAGLARPEWVVEIDAQAIVPEADAEGAGRS